MHLVYKKINFQFLHQYQLYQPFAFYLFLSSFLFYFIFISSCSIIYYCFCSFGLTTKTFYLFIKTFRYVSFPFLIQSLSDFKSILQVSTQKYMVCATISNANIVSAIIEVYGKITQKIATPIKIPLFFIVKYDCNPRQAYPKVVASVIHSMKIVLIRNVINIKKVYQSFVETGLNNGNLNSLIILQVYY